MKFAIYGIIALVALSGTLALSIQRRRGASYEDLVKEKDALKKHFESNQEIKDNKFKAVDFAWALNELLLAKYALLAKYTEKKENKIDETIDKIHGTVRFDTLGKLFEGKDYWKNTIKDRKYVNGVPEFDIGKITGAPAQPQAPPANNQAPPANNQAPPANNQAPPANNQAPPANNQAPPANNQAPPANNQAPPANNQAPPANNQQNQGKPADPKQGANTQAPANNNQPQQPAGKDAKPAEAKKQKRLR